MSDSRPRRRLSITARLVLGYTLVAELILISAAPHQANAIYGRLCDAQGTVLAVAPDFDEAVPDRAAFPGVVGAEESPGLRQQARLTTPDGELFLMSARVRQMGNRPDLLYQAVLHAGPVEEWLTDYNRMLGVFIAVATVASALFGWLVARNGLAPLRDITRFVQEVTAAGLGERPGTRPWPAELAALAGEFDRMLERLDDSFNRLSQFTADAAHEFRTPLNNLMGATSLVFPEFCLLTPGNPASLPPANRAISRRPMTQLHDSRKKYRQTTGQGGNRRRHPYCRRDRRQSRCGFRGRALPGVLNDRQTGLGRPPQQPGHGFRAAGVGTECQIGNSVPPPLARAVASSLIAAMGLTPHRPAKALALGHPALLSMDMSRAAFHLEIDVPIQRRDRKSGARKRSQLQTEVERLAQIEIDEIAIFELCLDEAGLVKTVEERHYQLVPAEGIHPGDLEAYRTRAGKPF